jgi:hypothetical protein
MPYIEQMLQEAQRLYGTGGPRVFSGSTVAELDPAEVTALQYLQSMAGPHMAGMSDAAREAWQRSLNLPGTIMQSPEIRAMVQASTNDIIQQLTERAYPYIRTGARATGGAGGTRQSLAEALTGERLGRQAMDVASNIYGTAYQNAWNTAMNALGQAGAVQQMPVAAASALASTGATYRAQEQARLEEEAAKWYYEQYMPYQALMEYANLIRTPYGEVGVGAQEVPEVGTAQTVAGVGLMALPWILRMLGIGR